MREDLGFIPLVTPTSQIVGTQAVLNVLTGERYKTIAKETAGILKGEYGHTPVPVNAALQARVLDGAEAITCRPADLLKPELAELEADVRRQAQEKGIQLAGNANAADKLDQVLAEIPRVREDLGFIPLVTPTSQIVGTQAVLNVLTGERYKTIAKETAGILKGEYGHTPVPVNAALQARVLDGGAPVTCRPADLLKPELAELEADVRRQAQEKGIQLAENAIDDVLTVALFPQIGLKFLENRNNPAAFEPLPQAEAVQPVAKAEKPAASGIYTVEVEGKAFVVKVSDGGDISQLTAAAPAASSAPATAPAGAGTPVTAPLAGNIWKVIATEGQTVAEGDVLLILEAMKMETEIRAAQAGTVRGIAVKSGDAVSVGDTLMTLA
nr:biotin/lipoyl-containing protein [Salmonella enterica]